MTVEGPRIYADFQNADAAGRLRLNCVGTTKDLARKHVVLRPGAILTLYSDDVDVEGNSDELEVSGVVEYSEAEQCWVARVDWNALRHASELHPEGHSQHQPQVNVAQS
jgi:hypothetical protein